MKNMCDEGVVDYILEDSQHPLKNVPVVMITHKVIMLVESIINARSAVIYNNNIKCAVNFNSVLRECRKCHRIATLSTTKRARGRGVPNFIIHLHEMTILHHFLGADVMIQQ